MGVPEVYLRGSLRLTLGTDNTPADIDRCWTSCRPLSPASAHCNQRPAAPRSEEPRGRDPVFCAHRGGRMAQRPAKPKPRPHRKKMTLEEIRADVERLKNDPRILAMIREADDPANAGDVVRWEDLKRKHAGR